MKLAVTLYITLLGFFFCGGGSGSSGVSGPDSETATPELAKLRDEIAKCKKARTQLEKEIASFRARPSRSQRVIVREHYSDSQKQTISFMQIKINRFKNEFGFFPRKIEEFRTALGGRSIPMEEKSRSNKLHFSGNGQGGWYYDKVRGKVRPNN